MSPLEELRRNTGLGIGAMAAALGVDYHALYGAERGNAGIPHKVKVALGELGVDVADLERRQGAWRQERARKLREELAGKIACAGGACA